MEAHIFVSAKIKKSYKRLALVPPPEAAQLLEQQNSWNAHYMLIFRKKCWVLSHAVTRYTVIVPDVTAPKLKDFHSLFLEAFVSQLRHETSANLDKIEVVFENLIFHPTNGDRAMVATVNQRIAELPYWQYEATEFDQLQFDRIGFNLNRIVGNTIDGKKVLVDANKDMLKWLDAQ